MLLPVTLVPLVLELALALASGAAALDSVPEAVPVADPGACAAFCPTSGGGAAPRAKGTAAKTRDKATIAARRGTTETTPDGEEIRGDRKKVVRFMIPPYLKKMLLALEPWTCVWQTVQAWN